MKEEKKDISKTFIEIGVFVLFLLIAAFVVFFVLNKTGYFVKNKTKKINSNEAAIKKEITNYLANAEHPNQVGGNCFASFKDYGTDKRQENTIYIQYYVQCYKLGEKEIVTLNGYSIPAKVILEKKGKDYTVKDIEKPSESNVNTLFPKDISIELSKAKEDGTIKSLKDNVDKQAKDYYGELKVK